MRQGRGFTMIELLVVIAIIGLISMVILTGITTARNKARYQSAFTAAKGVQSFANLCLTDANTVMCMPGQATLGCSGSGLDTINGGNALICTTRTSRFTTLPLGWLWCDSNGSGLCGAVASSPGSTGAFVYRILRTADNMYITCTETGCVCTGTGCPNL